MYVPVLPADVELPLVTSVVHKLDLPKDTTTRASTVPYTAVLAPVTNACDEDDASVPHTVFPAKVTGTLRTPGAFQPVTVMQAATKDRMDGLYAANEDHIHLLHDDMHAGTTLISDANGNVNVDLTFEQSSFTPNNAGHAIVALRELKEIADPGTGKDGKPRAIKTTEDSALATFVKSRVSTNDKDPKVTVRSSSKDPSVTKIEGVSHGDLTKMLQSDLAEYTPHNIVFVGASEGVVSITPAHKVANTGDRAVRVEAVVTHPRISRITGRVTSRHTHGTREQHHRRREVKKDDADEHDQGHKSSSSDNDDDNDSNSDNEK